MRPGISRPGRPRRFRPGPAAAVAGGPVAALVAGTAAACAARAAYSALTRRPPGGAGTWTRTNHRGEQLTLLEGPALTVGSVAVSALGPGLPPRVRAALAVAGTGAAAFGGYDDLAGSGSRRGFRGHLGALARGEVTTGAVKLGGIGATGLVSAALLGGGPADVAVNAGLVAGGANLLNLFDLRPGRALKVALASGTLLAMGARRGPVRSGTTRPTAGAATGPGATRAEAPGPGRRLGPTRGPARCSPWLPRSAPRSHCFPKTSANGRCSGTRAPTHSAPCSEWQPRPACPVRPGSRCSPRSPASPRPARWSASPPSSSAPRPCGGSTCSAACPFRPPRSRGARTRRPRKPGRQEPRQPQHRRDRAAGLGDRGWPASPGGPWNWARCGPHRRHHGDRPGGGLRPAACLRAHGRQPLPGNRVRDRQPGAEHHLRHRPRRRPHQRDRAGPGRCGRPPGPVPPGGGRPAGRARSEKGPGRNGRSRTARSRSSRGRQRPGQDRPRQEQPGQGRPASVP